MASCLDSPKREHLFMTSKINVFKKADPPTPTLTCAQNLFVERTFVNWKINPFQSEVSFLYPMKTKFSEGHRKATS